MVNFSTVKAFGDTIPKPGRARRKIKKDVGCEERGDVGSESNLKIKKSEDRSQH
jgi:hypothetical protein